MVFLYLKIATQFSDKSTKAAAVFDVRTLAVVVDRLEMLTVLLSAFVVPTKEKFASGIAVVKLTV
jgi:hypothetical protein